MKNENKWKRRFPNEDVIPFEQKKFKRIKINNRMIKIDLSIANDIMWLNKNGYITAGCHSGVPEDHIINTPSKFNNKTWIRFLDISDEQSLYLMMLQRENIISSARFQRKINYFAIYFNTIKMFRRFIEILKKKEYNNGRKNSILLCGFEKVGNTWIRFLIYNYFYVLNFGSKKTLTYEELRSLTRNIPFFYKGRLKKGRSPFKFKEGYPKVGYTHSSFDGYGLVGKINHITDFWNFFDKSVYIYRNPFDVIISNFYYWTNRKKPLFIHYTQNSFISFVDFILKKYIYHIKKTIDKVDIILNYDKLRKDPNEFRKVLRLLVNKIDEEAFKKTVELSSFENIRKMGIEMNQKYGMGRKYKGHFTRDGRSGQYKEIMKPKLIRHIKNKWKEAGLNEEY